MFQTRKSFSLIAGALMVVFIFTAMFAFSGGASAAVATGTNGNCEWELTDANELIITPKANTDGALASNGSWGNYVYRIYSLTVMPGVTIPATSSTNSYGYWFRNLTELKTVNISQLNTTRANNLSCMFSGCSKLEKVDLSGLDTKRVVNMSYMFENCSSLQEVDFSISTASCTNMANLLTGCSALNKITFGSEFVPYGTPTGGMTTNTAWLQTIHNGVDVSGEERVFTFSQIMSTSYPKMEGTWERTSLPLSIEGYGTSGTVDWTVVKGELRLTPKDGVSGTLAANDFNYNGGPWRGFKDEIKSVVVEPGVALPAAGSGYWFSSFPNATTIDVAELNTDAATNMTYMFYKCPKLKTLDLSNFNTSGVSSMAYMFADCPELAVDISSFDTANVTNMNYMFQNTKEMTVGEYLKSGATTYFTPWYSTNYQYLHVADKNGASLLSNRELRTATELNSANMSNADRAGTWVLLYRGNGAQYLDGMTAISGTVRWTITKAGELILEPVNGTIGTLAANAGEEIYKDANITSVTVKKTVRLPAAGCPGLFANMTGVTTMDLTGLDTTGAADLSRMFLGCTALTDLDVTGFNTSAATNMTSMFSGVHYVVFGSQFDRPSAAVIFDPTTEYVHLTSGGADIYRNGEVRLGREFPDLTNAELEGSWIMNLPHQAEGRCGYTIPATGSTPQMSQPIKWYITSWGRLVITPYYENTTPSFAYADFESYSSSYGSYYYYGRKPWQAHYLKITSVEVIGKIYTTKTNLSASNPYGGGTCIGNGGAYNARIFSELPNARTMLLADLDTEGAVNMREMFYNCPALEYIELGDNFDTSSVKNFLGMFNGDKALKHVDVSAFDTGQATDMSYMFYNCSALPSINVRNFNVANVTNMNYMFQNCSSLNDLDLTNWNLKLSGVGMTDALTGVRQFKLNETFGRQSASASYRFAGANHVYRQIFHEGADVTAENITKTGTELAAMDRYDMEGLWVLSGTDPSSVVPTLYIVNNAGGWTEVSPASPNTDDKFKVIPHPYSGKIVDKITVSGLSSDDPISANSDGTYTMPAEGAKVDVTFKDKPHTTPEDQNYANAVIALINAIAPVDLGNGSDGRIADARAAYDNLTDAQKYLVTNYGTLVAAEQLLARLQAEVDDALAAIGALDQFITIDANNVDDAEAAVDAAQAAWDVLTTAGQYDAVGADNYAKIGKLRALIAAFRQGGSLPDDPYADWLSDLIMSSTDPDKLNLQTPQADINHSKNLVAVYKNVSQAVRDKVRAEAKVKIAAVEVKLNAIDEARPVQDLIDALPAKDDINSGNKNDVQNQVNAIDSAIAGLSALANSLLDKTKLNDAKDKLQNLGGPDIDVTQIDDKSTGATITSSTDGSFTLTVTCGVACAVAYTTDNGTTYKKVDAVKAGNSYTFTFPVGTLGANIGIVKKGDVTLNGSVDDGDIFQFNRYINNKRTFTALAVLAGDVTGDGLTNDGDVFQLNRLINGKRNPFNW